MGTVYQLVSASLAAIFAVSLFVASRVFVEKHRAVEQPAYRTIEVMRRAS